MANIPTIGVPEEILADRYRLAEEIGRGGMGTVYRGTDLVLGREVALKIFRPDTVDTEQRARQQSEVRLLARLNHHGLVTLYDAGTAVRGQDEVSFLVMELVPGNDLRRRLAAGPLAGPETARIGAGLAEALEYIHHHGVVHRDVKPANILLARYADHVEPRPKLADFGIARMLDGARLTATNTMVGTATYLSPEQVSGASADYPSDIYSLGLVLLESLTGKVEYAGTAVEAAVARLSRDPQIPEELDPAWTGLLTAMTARDPADRPGAGEVAAALNNMTLNNMAPATMALNTMAPATMSLNIAAPAGGRAAGAVPARAYADPKPAAGDRGGILPGMEPAELTNATQAQQIHSSVPAMPPHGPSAPGAAAPAAHRPGPRQPRPRGTGIRRPRRSALWAVVALAVLALVITAVALAVRPDAGAMQAPSPTPTVTGDLGQHLQELEESVRP